MPTGRKPTGRNADCSHSFSGGKPTPSAIRPSKLVRKNVEKVERREELFITVLEPESDLTENSKTS